MLSYVRSVLCTTYARFFLVRKSIQSASVVNVNLGGITTGINVNTKWFAVDVEFFARGLTLGQVGVAVLGKV